MRLLKLSFIIPIYNAEKYLRICLDSLYQQNIPEDEYEVICVNDCSPDMSRDIVLEYQKNHENIVFIENEKNLGQGSSRNKGLRIAKAKYVWFIDSDDYVEKNCLSNLLITVEKDNLDILNFWITRDIDGVITTINSISDTSEVVCGATWLGNLKNNFDENGYCVTKIYKTTFLLDNHLSFPEILYEDQIFCLKAVYLAKRFKFIDKDIYFYRYNPQSTLNHKFRPLHYYSALACGTDYLSFYNTIKKDNPEFAEKVKLSGLWKINFGCKEVLFFNVSDRKKIINAIAPHIEMIQQSNYFKGFLQLYFRFFYVLNYILFAISWLLNVLRSIKHYIRRKNHRKKYI